MNQLLLRERNKIQRQRETEEKEKMWEKTHNEKYRKEVSDVIHKVKSEGKGMGGVMWNLEVSHVIHKVNQRGNRGGGDGIDVICKVTIRGEKRRGMGLIMESRGVRCHMQGKNQRKYIR